MTQPTPVPGRNNGFTLGTTGNLNSDYAVTHGYDIAGRLKTVTDAKGAYAYTYGYLANSRLREQVIGPVHTVTTAYEPHRDVLTGIENKAGATVVSNYAYVVNNLGQRKERVNSGTAFGTASTDVFTYNDKGEVTGSTNATLTARDQSFAYDDIGNRLTFTQTSGTTSYTANALNQYSELITSGQQLAPSYDLDGNLELTGAGQVYRWDGENRLIAIDPLVPTTGDKKQLNAYDAQSRRVRKQVFTYASGTWSLTTDEKFVYDGWNLIAKYDAQVSGLSLQVSYTWGTDLSGSLQAAGGVGGLLSAKDGGSVYHYTYDANGNVSEVLNSSGGIAAHYEYDAFGNTVASSGTYATTNAYRFSTKPMEEVSGLYHYGLRYYNPSSGRWLNRDPIEENGGVNLYGMIDNGIINAVDYIGLSAAFKCCNKEKRGAGKTDLQSKAKAYFDAQNSAGTPRGSWATPWTKEENSCHSLNEGLLDSFDPMPKCWECVLERRLGPAGRPWNKDHWLVVCTPKDESGSEVISERVTFDYWNEDGSPDGGKYSDFTDKYPRPGTTQSGPSNNYCK